MFTGIIEACGEVLERSARGDGARLRVGLPFAAELVPGESVAVNGCCLTVTAADAERATFDVLTKTLEVTSLGDLRAGDGVNLERALRADGRLGGHFVQGHVDDTGTIESLEADGAEDHVLALRLPPEVAALCLEKGSLAVDGISLTIAELEEEVARFWIIPHTWAGTNLSRRAVGERVNLEADVLAKHVARLLGA